MREGERPAVEFLDGWDAAENAETAGADAGADADAADNAAETAGANAYHGFSPIPPPPGSPRRSRPTVLLAGAGLAVAAVAAVALQHSSGDAPTAVSRTPASTPTSPTASAPTVSGTAAPPPEQGVGAAAGVPVLALLPTPRCAVPCVVVDWVADSTAHAVAVSFPGGTVQRQMTAFGPRIAAGHHPLLAREVTVRAGRVTVIVDVVPASGARWVAARIDARGDEVRGSATRAGYLIAARVVHGGQHAAVRLRRMLDDPGLMSVR